MPQKNRTASGALGGILGLVGLSAVAGVLITATVTPAIAVTGAAADLGVKKGDTLVGVDDDDLRGHGFDRCVAFLKRARERRGSSVLSFHRPRRRAASSGVSL